MLEVRYDIIKVVIDFREVRVLNVGNSVVGGVIDKIFVCFVD